MTTCYFDFDESTLCVCVQIKMKYCTVMVQSNLCTTTTLGTLNLWPLLTGGRCSEVALCYKKVKMEPQNGVVAGRWSLAQVWLYLGHFESWLDKISFIGLTLMYQKNLSEKLVMNICYYYFFQFFGQLSKDLIFVEELSLISVLKVFRDSLSHLARKFAIRHVLLNLFHLKTKMIAKQIVKHIWRKDELPLPIYACISSLRCISCLGNQDKYVQTKMSTQ